LYCGDQILQVLHSNNQKNTYFHWPRVELFNRKACMVKWQSYLSHCTFFKLCSLVPTSFIYTVSISLVHSHRTCCYGDFTFILFHTLLCILLAYYKVLFEVQEVGDHLWQRGTHDHTTDIWSYTGTINSAIKLMVPGDHMELPQYYGGRSQGEITTDSSSKSCDSNIHT